MRMCGESSFNMHRQGACECIAYVGTYIVTHSMMLPAGKQMAKGNNRMV